MAQYLPIVVLAVLAIVFGVISFVHVAAARAHGGRRQPRRRRTSAASCRRREPPERFPVSFYIVAMLFIMFDIEIIFMYPYAVSRSTLGSFGFWAMFVFSVMFFIAFVYVVARGGLDWGPLKRSVRVTPDRAGWCRPNARTRTTIRARRRRGPTAREEAAHEAHGCVDES